MASAKPNFRGKAITVVCTDQRRSERFYENVLGANRLPGDGYGCSWFQLGSLTLSLMPNARKPSTATIDSYAMNVLWLEVENLRAVHQYFLQMEVPVDEIHEELFMIIRDPDGLLIEVWQAQKENL